MKLITEFNDSLIEYKVESNENSEGLDVKEFFIEGIFMQSEVKNRNGRVYEKNILKKAVDRYINEQVKQNRAVGELNHPPGPTVNYQEVSHKIEDLWWEGNDVMGRAKILDTPNGKIVQKLIEANVKIGVSSRGMGSITKRGDTVYVKEDFTIATIDIVQDPSAHNAFVDGIMEGVEWTYENGIFKQIDCASDDSTSIQLENNKSINNSDSRFIKSFRQIMSELA